jgi:transcriptional regulator with XRE-family HTH domain
MSDLSSTLKEKFREPEYRHIYAEQLRNSWVAAQIKAIREQRGLTQAALAQAAGMLQARISVLEDVNYESWSINTLRRLAVAFDVDLEVKFVPFSAAVRDADAFSAEALKVSKFEDDPFFQESVEAAAVTTGTEAALIQGEMDIAEDLEGDSTTVPDNLVVILARTESCIWTEHNEIGAQAYA